MNEKRFWFVIDDGKLDYVQDNVTGEKITVTELEDLLNNHEQKIKILQREINDVQEILEMLNEKLKGWGGNLK